MDSTTALPRSRQQILFGELSGALAQAPKDQLQAWGKDSVVLLGRVTRRRAKNFGSLLKKLGAATVEEAKDAKKAYDERRLKEHASTRAKGIASSTADVTERLKDTVNSIRVALAANPKEAAPALVVSLLAFVAASGGVDGDGGAPDLDLIAGIDAHRSIFTHSVLSGAVIETLLASSAQLIALIHGFLPEQHDPIWDAIAKHKDQYLAAAAQGASLGVAYHLFVDSTLQPAPYHDLPGEHPLAVHQAVMGANAAAEGLDADKKLKTFQRPQVKPQNG